MRNGSPTPLAFLVVLGTLAAKSPPLTIAAGTALLFIGLLARKLWTNRSHDQWGGGND